MPVEGGFDEYCRKYLEQWEKRATVRHLPRTRLSAEAARHELYPASMQPLLAHAEVVALGPEARHRLLARAAAIFMLHVAILEVDLITELCVGLANRGAGAAVPEAARQVALTVGTDEVYHSYVAREFLGDLEAHTGVVPGPAGDSDMPILGALAEVRQHAPPELARAADTMVLCFAENFVTEELFGLSKEADPAGPFHVIMREHMMDEGRHQIYFQKLLRHVWDGLDEERRTALGALVPRFFDSFLKSGSFEASQADLLGYVGFDGESAKRIAREAMAAAYGTERPAKSRIKFMRNALHLVEVSGILGHPPTRRTLVESGWVEA